MDHNTLLALHASIEHWERLSTGAQAKNEDIYGADCALCKQFCEDINEENACKGCPVMQFTGLPVCQHTPWGATRAESIKYGMSSTEFRMAASKQLEFLKSLVPK